VSLLTDDVTEQLKDEFQSMKGDVRLLVFSQALADPESEEVKRLMEELGALEPKLKVEPVNFVLEKERAAALGVTRTPAIAILGAEKDYGIRFYGLPTGYEFGSLIDSILLVSNGESGLSAETKKALAELPKPVHVQVFSTPT
jgi:alkyl hydroperoxide reductase subunit AhpF